MAHITGGGLRNLLRLGNYHFKLQQWNIPEIFKDIQNRGSIAEKEMYTTFNMGIGFVIIVSPEQATKTVEHLNQHFFSVKIGEIEVIDEPLVSLGKLQFRSNEE